MDIGYFRTLARYNAWANHRLYDACLKLPEDAYYVNRKVFFGSIHRTLNHILLGSRAWMARIEGIAPSETGITSLDQELYTDRDSLWFAQQEEDARVIDRLDTMDMAQLGGELSYRTMTGIEQRQPLSLILGHLFNHGTHHRGQVHAMLSQVPTDPPPLDLIYFLRDQETNPALS